MQYSPREMRADDMENLGVWGFRGTSAGVGFIIDIEMEKNNWIKL